MHDDWDWGLSEGLRHLLYADINSRYAGNLVEVILTRVRPLKTFVMGAVMTGIPWLMMTLILECLGKDTLAKDTEILRASLFFFCNLTAVLMTPIQIWRQTYGWIAGFSNYAVSEFLIFLLLLFLKRKAERKTEAKTWMLFMLGVSCQLFLENITLFLFACLTCLVVYDYHRKKKIGPEIAALYFGSALGLIIMFSSNVYQTLWNTGSAVGEYRHLAFQKGASLRDILIALYQRAFYAILPETVQYSGHLTGGISMVMLLQMYRRFHRERNSRVLLLLLAPIHLGFAGFYFYAFYLQRFDNLIHLTSSFLSPAVDCLYYCVISAELLSFKRDHIFPWMLFTWLAPIFVLAPMIFLSEVGSRAYLASNLFYAAFLSLALFSMWSSWKRPIRIAFCIFSAVCTLVFSVHFGSVYSMIGAANRERLLLIKHAREEKVQELYLQTLPRQEYLWFPEPLIEERERYFKLFFEIPEDTVIIWEQESDKNGPKDPY